jgi:hypothetical protein
MSRVKSQLPHKPLRMAGKPGADILNEEEIQVTYVRQRTGRSRTIPVWFTVNEGRLELLPMHGLRTKWFTDVQKSGSLELEAKGWKKEASPVVVRNLQAIERIRERFAVKYGEGNVRKYYPTQDVALEIAL